MILILKHPILTSGDGAQVWVTEGLVNGGDFGDGCFATCLRANSKCNCSLCLYPLHYRQVFCCPFKIQFAADKSPRNTLYRIRL
ncbi:hypothetical protein XELAEV_18029723mg [Xenopus laevis]|uniref:Uncharacterized protein n=1 Tax=Xenopus laevis TaxID=8355 RepID=A0A974HI06_XENLA|nr:hypothetical protein XELAEV_18029723mg [Xenopus laevis]